MTVGTPTYMAPEQAMAGEIGPWTDLYSVGVLTYELLVGSPPFSDTDTPVAILMRHVNERIPSPIELEPTLDPGLSEWVDSLLVKDPQQRVRHALDAWESLEEIIVRLLGPLWRRDARLLADHSDAVEADPLDAGAVREPRLDQDADASADSRCRARSSRSIRRAARSGRSRCAEPEPEPGPEPEPAPEPEPGPEPEPAPEPESEPPRRSWPSPSRARTRSRSPSSAGSRSRSRSPNRSPRPRPSRRARARVLDRFTAPPGARRRRPRRRDRGRRCRLHRSRPTSRSAPSAPSLCPRSVSRTGSRSGTRTSGAGCRLRHRRPRRSRSRVPSRSSRGRAVAER